MSPAWPVEAQVDGTANHIGVDAAGKFSLPLTLPLDGTTEVCTPSASRPPIRQAIKRVDTVTFTLEPRRPWSSSQVRPTVSNAHKSP